MFGRKKHDAPKKPVSDAEEVVAITNLAEAFVWAEMQAQAKSLPTFLSHGGFSALRASLSTTIKFMPDDVAKRMEDEVDAAVHRFMDKVKEAAAAKRAGGDDVPPQ